MCLLCAKILPIIDDSISQFRIYKLGFKAGERIPNKWLIRVSNPTYPELGGITEGSHT